MGGESVTSTRSVNKSHKRSRRIRREKATMRQRSGMCVTWSRVPGSRTERSTFAFPRSLYRCIKKIFNARHLAGVESASKINEQRKDCEGIIEVPMRHGFRPGSLP